MIKKTLFISYSDQDNNKMRSLERVIQGSKSFAPIIIADNRQALVQLTEKVSNGILTCDYFVPIITRKSVTTQWINQEIGYAIATKRKIIPIVEIQLIDKLKGFIHKQLDLSYSFEGSENNPHSESVRFSRVIRTMINDLLIENDFTPNKLTLENIFSGKWTSTYFLEGSMGTDKEIEIRDGNKYFVQGKHWFNIEGFKIDLKVKKLRFKKVGIGQDGRTVTNDLKIVELSKRYEGTEDNYIPVVYTKNA
jgi:hypothetical protein